MLQVLNLSVGSEESPQTLSKNQVSALISAANDKNILHKDVKGYVFVDEITEREKYILEELGLNVKYNTITSSSFSISANRQGLYAGETTMLNISSATGVTVEDLVFVYKYEVVSGETSVSKIRNAVITDAKSIKLQDYNNDDEWTGKITISVHTKWDASDVKSVSILLYYASDIYLDTEFNRVDLSATLNQSGNRTAIENYIAECRCYVFDADGRKKAEIKSATFEGVYSGMTKGEVTFTDGTKIDINTLNQKGCNFMVWRPRAYFKVTGDTLRFYGTREVTGADYIEGKYIGMFKAYNDAGKLKSQPNREPSGSMTIAAFHSAAQILNLKYGLWNYSDWCKENMLHLSAFGNTNYETNVGVGRITDYDNVRGVRTGFTLPIINKGGCGFVITKDRQGRDVKCLNFFNIEGLGEQIWEFVIGFRHDGNNAYIWNENEWSENHAGRQVPLLVKSASQQYISMIIGGKYFDMLPKSVTGTGSTTGFCDGHWVSTSGRLLFVGGSASNGSLCGLSASYANDAFSYSKAAVGSRLAFYGEPSEVSGANLLN